MGNVTSSDNGSDLVPRVLEMLSDVFRVPVEAVSPSARMGDPPAWDSMGHMEVIVALEREFGVTFPTYRLPDLVSVPEIVAALRELGVGGETAQ